MMLTLSPARLGLRSCRVSPLQFMKTERKKHVVLFKQTLSQRVVGAAAGHLLAGSTCFCPGYQGYRFAPLSQIWDLKLEKVKVSEAFKPE